MAEEDEDVRNKFLGSLEFLAIKNDNANTKCLQESKGSYFLQPISYQLQLTLFLQT